MKCLKSRLDFIKVKGLRNHIANLRWITEKAREMQKDIFMCFIDYSKAFDCVDHNLLWRNLQELGIPRHLVKLINNLYTNEDAAMRILVTHRGLKLEKGYVKAAYYLHIYLILMLMFNLMFYRDDSRNNSGRKNDK